MTSCVLSESRSVKIAPGAVTGLAKTEVPITKAKTRKEVKLARIITTTVDGEMK